LNTGSGAVQFNGAVGGVTSLAGLNINAGNVEGRSSITVGTSGININAGDTVKLNGAVTASGGNGVGITANNDITTQDIVSPTGITLESNRGSVSSGNLNSSATAEGGDIGVAARNTITTGQINSSGAAGGGGNITLNANQDIQVTGINAQGGTSGGTVNITTEQFFRAIGTVSTANGLASISTVGGNGGGAITIRHGGGGLIPFDVGNGKINGTAGAITSGNFAIAPLQSFPFTYKKGNIQIISVPGPQLPEPANRIPDRPINAVDQAITQGKPESQALQHSDSKPLDKAVENLDKSLSRDFEQYFGLKESSNTNLTETRNILRRIELATGIKPAVIYAVFVPDTITPAPPTTQGLEEDSKELSLLRSLTPNSSDRLELILLTAEGKPVRKSINVTRSQTLARAREFRLDVTNVRDSRSYFTSAKQLYQWLLAPLEPDLQKLGIKNLVYITDIGLRTIPLAALYDGKSFIVERYSVGLMPSLSLTDTSYRDIRNSQVLAMGASEFKDKRPLPAVPAELDFIIHTWPGKSFLNQEFTLDNLKSQRATTPFGIIHLATHATFMPGDPRDSYIQLSDQKLSPFQLRALGWTKPSAELLVLSACRTAIGDEQVELGFAGLAVQAGAKSAVASLWNVNDEGTLALMSEFYQQLKQAPIKAEALREAQIAMLAGKARIENGKLFAGDKIFNLPPPLVTLSNVNLSHPYYWSGFTIVGNPW
jgi:CHAT domain-containing protein